VVQRRTLLQGVAAAATSGFGTPALAQTFPDRPIRLVVPYAPGGATDATLRVLAGPMGEILGQSFVVENRTGGAGASAPASSPRHGRTGTRSWPIPRPTP